jgi:hypothetical protein
MDVIEADDDELERRDREARLNTMRNSGIWTRSRDTTPTKPAPAGTPNAKASPSQPPPPSKEEVASAEETSATGDSSGAPAAATPADASSLSASKPASDTDQSGSDHSVSSFDDDYDDGDIEEPEDVPEPRQRREPSIVGSDSGITEALLQADNYDISALEDKDNNDEGPSAAASASSAASRSEADVVAARLEGDPTLTPPSKSGERAAEDNDVTAAFPLTPRGRKFLEKLMRDPTLISDSLSRSPAVSPMRRTASLARQQQGASFSSSSQRIEAASSPRRRQSHSAPPAVRAEGEAGVEGEGDAPPLHGHGHHGGAAGGGVGNVAAGGDDGADNDSSLVDEFDSDSDEEAKTGAAASSSTAEPASASSASTSWSDGKGERAQQSNPAPAPSSASASRSNKSAFAGRRSQMPPGTYSRIFSTSVAGSFILEETPLHTFIVGAVLDRTVAAKVDIGDLLVSCSGQMIEDEMTLADVTAMLDRQARCCCWCRCRCRRRCCWCCWGGRFCRRASHSSFCQPRCFFCSARRCCRCVFVFNRPPGALSRHSFRCTPSTGGSLCTTRSGSSLLPLSLSADNG